MVLPINEKYSFKSFAGKTLKNVDPIELNNTIIRGSCFYMESNGWNDIFPDGMTGVRFERCNLDNCIIEDGNEIDDTCSFRLVLSEEMVDEPI